MNACKGFGNTQIWDDTGLQEIHHTCKEEGAVPRQETLPAFLAWNRVWKCNQQGRIVMPGFRWTPLPCGLFRFAGRRRRQVTEWRGGWRRLTAFSCWSAGSSCQCDNSWISQKGNDLPGCSILLQAISKAREPLWCPFLFFSREKWISDQKKTPLLHIIKQH